MGLIQFMSRRDNCWDNACIENFFDHLICKLYQFTQPETVTEIQETVKSYKNIITINESKQN